MNQTFIFENMLLSGIRGVEGSMQFNRFEPIGYQSIEKRRVAFEPFVLKTTDSTASPMEGCGSIPNVWDGSPCSIVKQDEKGLLLKYSTHQGALEVTVALEGVNGTNVIRQVNTVKNVSSIYIRIIITVDNPALLIPYNNVTVKETFLFLKISSDVL